MRRFGIAHILFVAILLRLILVIINLDFFTLPAAGKDAVSFERVAWELVNDHAINKLDFLFNSYFLSLLGSFIYSVVGRAPYVLHVLMAVLGTTLVFVSYRTSRIIWENEAVALRTAWFVTLFPQLLLHSAVFLRETPIAICIALCALSTAKYYKNPAPTHVFSFVLWAILGTLFHTGVVVILPTFIVAILLWPPEAEITRKTQRAISAIAAVTLITAGLGLVQYTGIGLGKFGGSFDNVIDKLETIEASDPTGGSAFPGWVRMGPGVAELWKVPVRMGIFITSPAVPFLVRSPSHLLGLLDALLYIGIVVLVIGGYKDFRKRPVVISLLVIVLALILVYSFGVSNFGTAIRHRAKFVSVLLVIAAASPVMQVRIVWERVKRLPANRAR